MVTEPAPGLKDQTIGDFGEQWTAFRDNPGYYGSAELLADLFGPLLSLDDITGKSVADIGSGKFSHNSNFLM